MKRIFGFVGLILASSLIAATNAFAEAAAGAAGGDKGTIALSAAIAIAVAIFGAATGQSKAISSALEAIGRNPSATDQIKTPMIIGLVFMEALGIFAFVIAFFLQGKI